MTIFYHKLLTRGGRVLTNGWTHPSPMIIFVNLFIRKCHPESYHSDKKYHMPLNNIVSVVLCYWKFCKSILLIDLNCFLINAWWLSRTQRFEYLKGYSWTPWLFHSSKSSVVVIVRFHRKEVENQLVMKWGTTHVEVLQSH